MLTATHPSHVSPDIPSSGEPSLTPHRPTWASLLGSHSPPCLGLPARTPLPVPAPLPGDRSVSPPGPGTPACRTEAASQLCFQHPALNCRVNACWRRIPYTELQSKAHPHRHPEMWRVPTVMPAWSQIKQSRSIGACRVPDTVLGTGVWHITSLNSAISTGIMQRELSLCREGHITPNEATNPNPLV